MDIVSSVNALGRPTVRSAGMRTGAPLPANSKPQTKNKIFKEGSIYDMAYLKNESKGIWKTENLSKGTTINLLV